MEVLRVEKSSSLRECLQKKLQREKRRRKDGMEKRTYRRLVSAFHIPSISLFVAWFW
jgi:hypothetical protein